MGGIESDSARRVLSDYRQTVSDLMLDGFTTMDLAERDYGVVIDRESMTLAAAESVASASTPSVRPTPLRLSRRHSICSAHWRRP